MSGAITTELLNKFQFSFYSDPKNILAQNVCSRFDPYEACLSRPLLEDTQHVFSHKIETEGKPVTNQKVSGRCWIFACLNSIRTTFMKQHNIEEFEFSQAYLFFWDKIERSNYFLNNMVYCAQKGDPVDGRLVSFLLHDPTCDGGQWDMLCNLITKYGLMPKKCFPESFSSETSSRLNAVLKSKLREYTKILRDCLQKGATDGEIHAKIQEQMSEIYRIVGICLGIPREKFVWEYYDKTKNYHSVGPVTPVEFYEQLVKPHYNVENKVCLVNDPRPSSPYGRSFTVEFLGNMVGGRQTVYNNQEIELLMKFAAESIKNNEPVWFGCEVAKRFAGKQGIEDLTVHNYKNMFGVEVSLGMTKAERLLYGESLMTHAMVFTAVSVKDDHLPTKWRVENSWGDERGEKGYLVMTNEWFKEFVFEVVIDKKYVPEEVLSILQMDPIVLPAWDPMGALAQ